MQHNWTVHSELVREENGQMCRMTDSEPRRRAPDDFPGSSKSRLPWWLRW